MELETSPDEFLFRWKAIFSREQKKNQIVSCSLSRCKEEENQQSHLWYVGITLKPPKASFWPAGLRENGDDMHTLCSWYLLYLLLPGLLMGSQ